MIAVTEGMAGLLVADIPHLSRVCAEARLEAHQSPAKGVLDVARRGVLRTEPHSEGLLPYRVIERICSTIPAVINVPPLQLSR